MRLKRLELFGFKTFADATELQFDDGITAIIGPNGSGKSNCADALLWVLAERRLSTIRAAEPSDVIFAGSRDRRPLGYAEVNLTIDNADGGLPIELAEVAVGRRIYRNGDSEYRLNGRSCRRRDVVELFMDTGIGRPAFSVISQREADALLSLDPADRRRLLDEVAGIERYRTQRDETLRRLTDVAASLTRVDDLTAELRARVEPLAEQSRLAEEFIALRDQAHSLRLSLLVKDHQLAARRAERLAEERDALAATLAAAEADSAEYEAAEQVTRLALLRLDEQLTEARGTLAEERLAQERADAELRLVNEQMDHLRSRLTEAERAAATRAELAASEAQRDATDAQETERLALQSAELAAARDGEAAVAAAARATEVEAHHLVEAARAAQAGHERELAEHRARSAAARDAQLAAERQQAALAQRAGDLGAALTAADAQLVASQAQAAAASTALASAEAERQGTGQARVAAEQALAQARTTAAEGVRQLAEYQGRLSALEAAASAYEGSDAAVKAVLKARDAGRLSGEYETFASVLTVQEGFEAAIEAMLGPQLQSVLCRTTRDALAAIALLRADRAGRATFLAVEEQAATAIAQPPASQLPGAVAWAQDVVSCPATWRPALVHLPLTLVVEDLDAAAALAEQADLGTMLYVTRDGQALGSWGHIAGGSEPAQGAPLLSRRRETQELRRAVAAAESALASAQAQVQLAGTALDEAQRAHRAAGEALDTQRRALAQAERTSQEARASLGRAEADRARHAEALTQAAAAAETAQAAAASHEAAAAQAMAEGDRLAADLAVAESRWTDARAARELAEQALATAREGSARAESRLNALREAARRRQESQARAAAEADRLAGETDAWQSRLDELSTRGEALYEAVTQRKVAVTQASETVETLRAAHQTAAEEVNSTSEQSRAARAAAHAAGEAQHRAELRQAQTDAELTYLAQSLDTDYPGLDLAAAEQQAEPVGNRSEAAAQLQALREAMADLGEVNLGAIEESKRVDQRLGFYAREQADLERARADLLVVMADIDTVSRERLMAAYNDVNREFDALFKRVFGADGCGAVAWSDPDNFLESGLDVLVEMPGKRTQNLTLLSGGERAMTTITLLLSMFKVKPTPFCLLDELDAPLDEANIRTYRELLAEFAQSSQFIVITHNPETSRAASTLYGITMAEPGVSRAYSYRLD